MTTVNRELSIEELGSAFLNDWEISYGNKSYELCRDLCANFINRIKPLYNKRELGESPEAHMDYVLIYMFLMLAKGLDNILDLVSMTAAKTWQLDQKETEMVWQMLWDAKERLDSFDNHYSDKNILQGHYDQLKRLEHYFYDIFGKGIYMSPVIMIKKSTCSICGKNIKACAHVTGIFYEGRICREVVDDLEMRGADMVNSPRDMRCRIWPWNFTDKTHINVRIMNLNQLDAFIFDDDNNPTLEIKKNEKN